MKSLKSFKADERGLAIVEAVYVFPTVILITVSLYFLAMFTYSRINLQASLDWYVDLSCQAVSSSGIRLSVNKNTVSSHCIALPKNPYRHLFMGKNELQTSFQQLVEDGAKQRDLMRATQMRAKLIVKNYILYKEVIGTASKTFKIPINLSFVGLPQEVFIAVSSKRMISDQDELIRNIDIALDVTSYYDTKYGISDKMIEMFGQVSGFVRKLFP